MYGRVYNSRYWTNSNSSRQYFPNTNGIADDVGRIGLIQDIGANKDSRGNLAYVSTFYSVPLASVKGGNPYVASINTEKLIGATGGNRYPNVSFEKLRLNVYETTPFESNLDIYYESSSSGIISQLNNYINQIGPSEENFVKAKEFLYKNVKSYSDSLRLIVMENK